MAIDPYLSSKASWWFSRGGSSDSTRKLPHNTRPRRSRTSITCSSAMSAVSGNSPSNVPTAKNRPEPVILVADLSCI